ncbi:MAG: gamma-glutamylcyclotransferase [Proteobacteria bacterium]|jgi:gamma-glutamylcyclotransferase|nr:gamma-glutamylcyclotransferase [Pseudomonadota bacterium]MDA1300955.1 gamma-glutamylcyclotransferase [Pseudomonadota bacterium]
MIEYYFAYGSNMNPARVLGRRMAFADHGPGVLHDYRLAFNKRSAKVPGGASANVMVAPGMKTEGVIYRLTSPSQIEMMDPFEGYPVRYDRRALPINRDGAEVEAWVYLANPQFVASGLKPARWYLNHLLAAEPYLSAEYLKGLMSVGCLDNTDHEPE